MSLLRPLLFCALFSFLVLGPACQSTAVSWVPDGDGHVTALQREPIRLPGLGYLYLGDRHHAVLEALRAHGFDCSAEAATSRLMACVRPPGKEEPTGGVVKLEFQQSLLAGVQAELEPPGDETGKLARQRFDELEHEWSHAFGRAEVVQRRGIIAARHTLRNGTALLAVCYEGEPTLVVEHVQLQTDKIHIPPPPRDSGTR